MQMVCLKAKESCPSQHAHTAPLEETEMSPRYDGGAECASGRLAHKPAPQLRRTRYAGHESLPKHKVLFIRAPQMFRYGNQRCLACKVNCRPTQRAPDVWESARFRSFFLASSFSLLPGRVHARPHAGNANRWVAQEQEQEQNQIRL